MHGGDPLESVSRKDCDSRWRAVLGGNDGVLPSNSHPQKISVQLASISGPRAAAHVRTFLVFQPSLFTPLNSLLTMVRAPAKRDTVLSLRSNHASLSPFGVDPRAAFWPNRNNFSASARSITPFITLETCSSVRVSLVMQCTCAPYEQLQEP